MRGARLAGRRNRLAWKRALKRREALLIGYAVAGDPDLDRSIQIAGEMVESGVDILEIGVPSADPRFDGEIIRRAHRRALRHPDVEKGQLPLFYWPRLRARTDAPIWAMGYRRELVDSGLYMEMARNGWIDGLVLPDCTLEEQRDVGQRVAELGVDVIRFVHAAMSDRELREAVDGAGILYVQLYRGTTGDLMARLEHLRPLCARLRRYTDALLVAGFGLSTAERVREAVESGFDGAVVGTALVACCERGELDHLYRMIADMKLETKLGTKHGSKR